MTHNNSAQGSEAPFNLGDYVTFDFDFEAPETSQAMSIDNPFDATHAEDFDTVLTGTSQHATQATPVDYSMMDALPTMSETDLPLEDVTVFEPMVLVANVDADALHNPGSLPSSPPNWLPPTLSFQPEPSRWVPVLPELQKQLNATYAPQLDLLACDPNPAPVLFLAAQDQLRYRPETAASHPSGDLSGYELPPTSEPRVGTASINPALLMRESTGLPPRTLPSCDTSSTSSSTTEQPAQHDAALTSVTTTKRAFDAGESQLEPTPKRIRIAEPEPMLDAKDKDSDDGAELDEKRVSLSQPDLLPVVVKENEPERTTETQWQGESENTQENDSNRHIVSSDSLPPSPTPIPPPVPVAQKAPSTLRSSKSSSKKAAHWRYEQANETDLRNQRRKQWSSRLTNDSTAARGKTPSRKMQKLLEEIEDTQGFVEAQGCKAGESVGENAGARRPVRSGARKSYVGQG
ncbi:hypothetical protein BDR22DRAFT_887215 [Usnea florida]